MAWTYYTANLAPGDLITKDQRDELLDALEERAIATGEAYHADMAAVRASEVLSRVVKTTGSTYSWDTLLINLATRYYSDTSAAVKFTISTFHAAIATALGGGLTETDVSNILSQGSLTPLASYWNAIREGVRLLSGCDMTIGLPVTGTTYRKTASAPVWADAKSGFISDTEDTVNYTPIIGTSESSFSTSYTVQGWRRRLVFDIPVHACFSNGYEMWVFASQGTYQGTIPEITLRVKHSGSNYHVTPPSSGFARATVSGLSATGAAAVSLDIMARAYEDAAELDTFPTPANSSSNSRTPGLRYGWKPTFTHP